MYLERSMLFIGALGNSERLSFPTALVEHACLKLIMQFLFAERVSHIAGN